MKELSPVVAASQEYDSETQSLYSPKPITDYQSHYLMVVRLSLRTSPVRFSLSSRAQTPISTIERIKARFLAI